MVPAERAQVNHSNQRNSENPKGETVLESFCLASKNHVHTKAHTSAVPFPKSIFSPFMQLFEANAMSILSLEREVAVLTFFAVINATSGHFPQPRLNPPTASQTKQFHFVGAFHTKHFRISPPHIGTH
ncbi:hypothetical protein CDAR_449791 [Caerostris darwini]|uniref:Uncharacterized protein n=1 Tax=Caerostris darwini TaxID=1538125 RepID=A0AAV4QTA1_9ARAC|nr:hypothetical protein CDAR_449791 [Caerostris darwini]